MPALIAITRESPPAIGRCRSCDARIEWVETAAGKRMPLDSPVRIAQRYQTQDGRTQLLVDGSATHWATCPDAAAHKRRRA